MTVTLASGQVSITPPAPTALAGYPDRIGNWTAIHDALEANAILLRTEETFVILVSLDLLYCGFRLRAEILARCPDVPPDHLVLGASHTHFAPATSEEQPQLGAVQDEYVEMCADRISGLIKRLLAEKGEPVCMHLGLTEPLRSSNRRQPVRRFSANLRIRNDVLFRPNPDGEVDPRGRVVTFSSVNDSKILAVIWGWSCHPVCFPQKSQVSADYPGIVRAHIRKESGPDLPVLFFQGFAGNIRPPAIGRSRLQRKRIFVPWTEAEWRGWASGIAHAVFSAISPGAQPLKQTVITRIERPLSDFVASAPEDRMVSFHGARLGDDLYMLGISAEPSVEYIGLLASLLPASASAFPVGCLDATYGYLPTTQQSIEGGYEGAEFLPIFSLPGRLNPGIGEKAKKGFQDLVDALTGSQN